MGRKALAGAPTRRNNMPVYLPFIPLVIWLGVLAVLTYVKIENLPELPDWQDSYFDHLILCIGALVGITMILILARRHFARRLKGFGLAVRRIHRIFAGKVIHGTEFQMQKHQELELILLHSQIELRVLIIITVIFVMPAFEELLFRGLFQTTIRSFLEVSPFSDRLPSASARSWLAIAISSGLFAAVHAYAGHWPALFVLAVCMGYAYEKSGSLFRPIFIHAFFNATSIVATLTQPPG
ncbi:MAG: lysostaphin resistance A-like protein [Planctomycetota bacterium]